MGIIQRSEELKLFLRGEAVMFPDCYSADDKGTSM